MEKPPATREEAQTLDAVTDGDWPRKNGEKENVPSPSGLPGGGWSQVGESGVHEYEIGKSSRGRADVAHHLRGGKTMSDLRFAIKSIP